MRGYILDLFAFLLCSLESINLIMALIFSFLVPNSKRDNTTFFFSVRRYLWLANLSFITVFYFVDTRQKYNK